MDDVWSVQAWDDLRRFFPDNSNRSRVMMTTRLSDVASSLSYHNPYMMTFLDENKSWDLFCQTIFAQEGCPYQELEKIGRKIVENCHGLPLEIIVIGGLLAQSDISRDYWKSIADNVSSFGNSGYDEHCLNILSLSYIHLPIHLKLCFLYMGRYEEDEKINVIELIQGWIANGFLRPVREKILEDIAMEFIKDLVARNLIFFHEWTSGEMKLCGIHDLLRDLCVKELDKEQFIESQKVQYMTCGSQERCSLCGGYLFIKVTDVSKFVLISPSSSIEDTYMCGACNDEYLHLTRATLVETIMDSRYPSKLVHPTQVRFISIDLPEVLDFVLPSTLHFLWNLQTLKIVLYPWARGIDLPNEIWEMPKLRHVEFSKNVAILPDPVIAHIEGEDVLILKKLQTLSGIKNFKCTRDILDKIPDLVKLGIRCESKYAGSMECSKYSLCNLIQLRKLQLLKIRRAGKITAFPSSLKKLTLVNSRCKIPWSGLSIIGSLPNLEQLDLDDSTEGSEWNPIEGEFLRLKRLAILSTNLVQWRADQIHFPILQNLALEYLYSLEEIPSGIGNIPTLRKIHLKCCNRSVINLANQIWEEQQSMENETLEIVVIKHSIWDEMYSISDFMSLQLSDDDEIRDNDVEDIYHESEDDEPEDEDEDDDGNYT